MTTFFTIGNINELVLKGHSYISKIGIKIIDDKNNKSSSFLEGHFYRFLDLLEIIELRKDIETNDDRLQELVLRLYGFVNNECIYYNSIYLDIDDPMFSGSVNIDTSDLVTQEELQEAVEGISGQLKTKLDITDNNNPTVIDWNNDIVPDGTGRTWAVKHGRLGCLVNGKWFNGTSYEKNDSYDLQDLYDGDGNLSTVTIIIGSIPFRFIII